MSEEEKTETNGLSKTKKGEVRVAESVKQKHGDHVILS